MRYNEKNSTQIGNKSVIHTIYDTNSIFEVSMIVISDINGTISSNYDLTVFGDITATSLSVMGNLICFGDCSADVMNVQGSCTIFGSLQVKDAVLSETLFAKDVDCEQLRVKGNTQCNSLICEGLFSCEGKVIISDGTMGTGELKCDLIICGEYSSFETDDNVFVITEIEEQLKDLRQMVNNTPQNEPLQEKISKISLMDWSECGNVLTKLAEHQNEYRIERDNYKKLFYWADLTKICDLEQFIKLLDLIYQPGEIFRNSDLYAVVKKDLFEKAFDYIYDLALPSISQRDFSEFLHIITVNREHLDPTIYHFLLEKMFAKIGLKYSTVSLMLGE